MQWTVCGFIVLVLIFHGHGTFIRNFIWKTEESLWFDAIEKNPNLPRPYHNLGLYYGHLGLRQKEKAMYEKALRCEKQPQYISHHRTYYNLAIVYILTQQEDKALEYLRKSIEVDPRYPEAYSNLGAIMLKRGKYDAAYDLLIKALSLDSRIPQAHNNLGFVLLKKGLLDEAIIEFKKAADLDASESIFPQNLGIAYKRKGEFPQAVQHLRASLKKNPKNLLARLHLLEIHCLLGRTDASKDLVTEGLEIMAPKRIHSEFMALLQKEAYLEIPNRDIISPILQEAFLAKSAFLNRMAKDFGSNGG
jgi:tetratricopeptide (TPR) repeat protein